MNFSCLIVNISYPLCMQLVYISLVYIRGINYPADIMKLTIFYFIVFAHRLVALCKLLYIMYKL